MARNFRPDQHQETNLTDFLKKRLPELAADNKERIDADKRSDLDYKHSKDYRAKGDTVFAESNMSVPLTAWVVDHFSARTEDEIFGRKPLAQFVPEGPADQSVARGVDRWANYRLFKLGKVDKDLLESQVSLWTHRAQILKAVYHEDADEWDEYEVPVLHDMATGKPVEILNHGFIVQGRDSFFEMPDPVTGAPVVALDVDPTFRLEPGRHEFRPAPEPIRYRVLNYAGAKSVEVDSDCFHAPADARTLDEAEIVAEYYDKPLWWVKRRFQARAWLSWEQFESSLGALDARKKTDSDRNRKFSKRKGGDGTTPEGRATASVPIIEVWMMRDVLGWGQPQKIVVWLEGRTHQIIDMEFQRMVTPDGKHPYTAVATWKPHGKRLWWGYSLVEMLMPFQEYIDKQWNRHSFRNSINANPILAEDPEAIQERKSFFELKPFEKVTLEQGKTVGDWLQAFVFPKLDLDTQDLIEKAIYWCNYWLGISNIGQGDYSDVPQNTTLGGQEASLREASKLSRRWTRRVKSGYEEHLEKLLGVAVDVMDQQEVYTYLEGDTEQSAWIMQDVIEGLKLNVRLVVGRERGFMSLQERQLAMQVVERYFSYPPPMQMAARPIMKASLFDLGFDDVDSLLPMPMTPQLPPGAVVDPAADLSPAEAIDGATSGGMPVEMTAAEGQMAF